MVGLACKYSPLRYATGPDSKEELFGEHLAQFCAKAGVNPDNIESLAVAWTLNCTEQGIVTRNEFIKGFSQLG